MSSRPVALALALLVTFLWSTSWVLIKLGLDELELPPLTFAGLRYVLAALVLLPLALPALRRLGTLRSEPRLAGRVIVLGLLLYAVTQGAQFAALVYLPAVAIALILSTTPIIVGLASLGGGERPSVLQGLGIGGLVVGAALYFGPFELGEAALLGLVIAFVGLAGNAGAALLGRSLARDSIQALGGAIGLTTLSMSVGAVVLVTVGFVLETLPPVSLEGWLIIGWLAVVNTALAFTLWNHTLRTLSAVESSVMNNLMLVQIAILAWVFLGEALSLLEIVGLVIALAGILLVQLAPFLLRRRAASVALAAGAVAVPGSPEATVAETTGQGPGR